MKKLVFADSWKQIFADGGFKTFGRFFNSPTPQTIHKKTKRNVTTITIGQGSDRREFFVKRFYHLHYKDILWTWRNFGRLMSQAAIEWHNAYLLLGYGFGTYKPVCLGEKIKWGIEKKSFIVTEKLKSQSLSDFIAQNWSKLPRTEKEKIMTALAKFIRRIHDVGIDMPDLYIWHVFIKETEGQYDFDVIDLHRMSHNVNKKNRQIKNLGRLDHSMLDKYFDENIRKLFIESYVGNDWPGDIKKLTQKVKKYSAVRSIKRKQRQY